MSKRDKREERKAEREKAAREKGSAERERFRQEIRSQRCPKCEGNTVSRYLYGLPAFSDELNADLDERLIILGGCCFSEDDPLWRCRACGHSWGSLRDRLKANQ